MAEKESLAPLYSHLISQKPEKVQILECLGRETEHPDIYPEKLYHLSESLICLSSVSVKELWPQEHIVQAVFSPLLKSHGDSKMFLIGGISDESGDQYPPVSRQIHDSVKAFSAQAEEHWLSIRLTEDIQAYSKKLESQVEERTRQLKGKTRDIQVILQTINLGIFTFGPDLCIQPEYFGFLKKMFPESDFSGLYFPILFEKYTNITEREMKLIQTVSDSCLGYPELVFTCNSHLLPGELHLKENHGQILELSWQPMTDSKNIVTHLMLIIRDVTEYRQLKESQIRQRLETSMITDVVRIGAGKFARFIQFARQTAADCQTLLEQQASGTPDLTGIFRLIHTLKGDAATYELDKISNSAHKFESFLEDYLKSPKESLYPLHQEMNGLTEIINSYYRIFREKIQSGTVMEDRSGQVCQQLIRFLEHSEDPVKPQGSEEVIRSLKNIVATLTYASLQEVLKDELESVRKLAISQAKNPPIVTIQADTLLFHLDARKKFTQIFSHLLRNSLDHGLEKPSTRLSKGKNPTGSITIRASLGSSLLIFYSDDGIGFSVKSLKEAFREKVSENKTFDLSQALFLQGLSTKKKVSLISGRGMGMDAVRSLTRELNGTVKIMTATESDSSEKGFIPVSLEFTFPSELAYSLRLSQQDPP